MKGELKKLALQELRQKGKKRSTKGAEKRGKLANITLIDERPEEVNTRKVPGHWEGDLIIGKDCNPASLVTPPSAVLVTPGVATFSDPPPAPFRRAFGRL